jgi:hypothetical protein
MRSVPLTALVLLASACQKAEPPAPSAAPSSSVSARTPEPEPTFDPSLPSFKCGKIRCNLDYYCVERKKGEPSELCTAHPPSAKREGCMKVATRSFVCETFP